VAKRLVVGSYFLLSLALLGSCASSEQAILITARASGTNPTIIDTVVVRVIPLMSTAAPVNSDSNPVHRTIQEINGDQPIRVAVHLHDPAPVMVHITAITASGSTLLYATRCYVPNGVLHDEILLVPLDATTDADGDGWPDAANLGASCRDPDPAASVTGVMCDIGMCAAIDAADCNDMPSATTPVNCAMPAFRNTGPCIYPGAPAICGDGIDQDCRANGLPGGSRDEPCGDMDGDGVNACGPAGGVCDCNDNNPNIHPGATDICGNGIDEDCSGEPGGMGAFCDADHDGYPSNVDCNDMNPNIHPGGLVLEHCDSSPMGGMCGVACTLVAGSCTCDGIDNNCNGLTDEDASCRSPDLDGDGADACATGVTTCSSCDCNDCDSGIHPRAPSVCGNTIDEDGIGGDPMCAPGDTDSDGFTGGQDCMEGDAHFHFGAAENCTTAASESCGTMSCPASVDADHDGFAAASAGGTDCNDMDPAVNAWATEVCNGVDDNCNAEADEVLDPTNMHGCVTDPMCTGGSRCTVTFATSLHHCGGCRQECNPGLTLVADQCAAGHCECTTNAGNAACAPGSTCCGIEDSMHNPVMHPGCYNTDTATENCGGCGNVCDPTTTDSCAAGHCVCGSTGAACGAGQTCCGGACVNLATDVNHCGRCDRACGANATCGGGTCGCSDAAMFGDCDGNLGTLGGNGCETLLQTDANHCGTCAQSCNDEHAHGTCAAGACTIASCDPLFADCNGGAANGCETSIATTANCGGCGRACSAMHADAQCIVAGSTASCGYGTCTGGFGSCDGNVMNGCETSLTSVSTCGACTTDCTTLVQHATPTCTGAGACDYSAGSCAAGSSDCDMNRANGCELFATTHCGPACTNCSTAIQNAVGASCGGGGTCQFTGCNGGASDCDGNPANGCETWSSTRCGSGCTDCTMAFVHATGQACSGAGACTFSGCAGTFIDCDGAATPGCEQAQDASHCGASCTNCSALPHVSTASCGGGACAITTCASGFVDCTGGAANGCETSEDAGHCGGSCTNCLGLPHVAGATCGGGTCSITSCSATFVDCTAAAGCETTEDRSHCGSSCTNCTTGYMNGVAACTLGTCDIGTCTATHADCDGNAANGCEATTPGTDADCCGATCTGMRHCMGSATTGYACL